MASSGSGWRLPRQPAGAADPEEGSPSKRRRERDQAGQPAGPKAKSAAGGKQQRRKKKDEKADEGEAERAEGEIDMGMVHTHIETLTKLVLNNTQQVRALVSCLHLTFLCPRSADYVKAGLFAGTQYQEQVRAEGKQHQRGPPHTHIFLASIEVLAERTEVSSSDRELITKVIQVLNMQSPDLAKQAILHYTIKDAYFDQSDETATRYSKITMAIDPLLALPIEPPVIGLATEFRDSIKRALLATGGIQKFGPAPKGQLERTIEQRLRAWQHARGKSAE